MAEIDTPNKVNNNAHICKQFHQKHIIKHLFKLTFTKKRCPYYH